MFDLKGKFRRVAAKTSRNDIFGTTGLTSVVGVIIGLPLVFLDGGITLGVSASTFLACMFAMSEEEVEERKKAGGSFNFDGKTYYLGPNQWVKMSRLETKIAGLKQNFYDAETNKARSKIEKKIQKLVNHQIDILKSANITTVKPKPKPPEVLKDLKIDRSFSKKLERN